MTLLRLKIHQIFRLLQICGSITCIWPRDPGAGRFVQFLRTFDWLFSTLNVTAVLMSMILAAYHHRHDVTAMMKAISEFTALIEVFFNLIICRLESVRIEHLLTDLKNFLHTSNHHERVILQKYIDRYSGFSAFVGISHILAIIAFSCGPIFLSTELPAEGWYPFPTDSPTVISILYTMQVYSIVQTGLNISTDFTFAMFFWFSAARLEMLCLEIRNAKSKRQINSCIKKHQEIIKFVDETRHTVQHIIFKTNVTMGSAAICGAFPIIHKQSLGITSQFICMVIGGCQRLYITAWPADDLRENVTRTPSERVAIEVYNTAWFGKSRPITKNIYFMIQRSQKPLLIGMGGLLPALSLEYYAKFLVTISSYFTTMKAIIGS